MCLSREVVAPGHRRGALYHWRVALALQHRAVMSRSARQMPLQVVMYLSHPDRAMLVDLVQLESGAVLLLVEPRRDRSASP